MRPQAEAACSLSSKAGQGAVECSGDDDDDYRYVGIKPMNSVQNVDDDGRVSSAVPPLSSYAPNCVRIISDSNPSSAPRSGFQQRMLHKGLISRLHRNFRMFEHITKSCLYACVNISQNLATTNALPRSLAIDNRRALQVVTMP